MARQGRRIFSHSLTHAIPYAAVSSGISTHVVSDPVELVYLVCHMSFPPLSFRGGLCVSIRVQRDACELFAKPCAVGCRSPVGVCGRPSCSRRPRRSLIHVAQHEFNALLSALLSLLQVVEKEAGGGGGGGGGGGCLVFQKWILHH